MSKTGLTWLLTIPSFSGRMGAKPCCRCSVFHCFGGISALCGQSCPCHRAVLHKLPLPKFSFPAWPHPVKLLCLDTLKCPNSNEENLLMCQISSWFGITLHCTNLIVQSVINLVEFSDLLSCCNLTTNPLIPNLRKCCFLLKKLNNLLGTLKPDWCFADL